MKNRDPFSSAYFFANSLIRGPLSTLRSVWRGINADDAEIEKAGYSRRITATFAALGTGLVASGVLTLDPVAIVAGTLPVADAAGRYLEVGNSLLPTQTNTDPPPPTPI